MNTLTRLGGIAAALLVLAACVSAGTKPNTAATEKNSSCLSDTGSLFVTKPPDCSAFGSSYTSEDMSRTGKTDSGQALKALDPSLRIHQ
jgi:hypothetical protein